MWLDRLPAKYADVGPRIVRQPDGNDAWVYEGAIAGNFALNAVAGKDPREFWLDPRRYDDMLPGCHDIHDRIKDMDLEGVWAQLCFPNMGGFAGSAFAKSKDWNLANDCIKAYNDFILDEWCAAYPERQIPLMMVPYWNVEQTVAEIRRTAAKGAQVDHLPRAPRPARAAVLAQLALGPGARRRVGGGPAAFAALRLRRLAAGLSPRGDDDATSPWRSRSSA